MSDDETLDAPDADIILRALGPPKRDFRVHKLVLSLASPVFKDMFSLPQPTSDNSRGSRVAELEIVEVMDPTNALEAVLRMIYPFAPPSFDGNLDTLVECLVITDKYDTKGVKSRLCGVLAQASHTQPLRVYAIACRFGFATLADSTSRLIFSSTHLVGIPNLPGDFDFVPATAYHKLIRQRVSHLEAVVEAIEKTHFQQSCFNCKQKVPYGVGGIRSGKEEKIKHRLAHLVTTGTPVEAKACVEAWEKAYGKGNPYDYSADCQSCIINFIHSAIPGVDRGPVMPEASPSRGKRHTRRRP